MLPFSLNIRGTLLSLEQPLVMGIVNVTPDSFYAPSRTTDGATLAARIRQIIREGGSIVDIGACSTRPGSTPVDEAEEMKRLRWALTLISRMDEKPILSIDTFRASVAKMCVEEYGAHIINDISGGDLDSQMLPTVARLSVPYILMHTRGTPTTMQQQTRYEHLLPDILSHLSERIDRLRQLGAKDIIVDPGFGFAKSIEQNYELLSHLSLFRQLGLPILVGLSRKSMATKLLHITPEEALPATTALHAFALATGAVDILRVHDVLPAVQAVKIYSSLTSYLKSPTSYL